MVLQIILDKQTTILLTFSELGAIFDLSLKDESLNFEYSFIDELHKYLDKIGRGRWRSYA